MWCASKDILETPTTSYKWWKMHHKITKSFVRPGKLTRKNILTSDRNKMYALTRILWIGPTQVVHNCEIKNNIKCIAFQKVLQTEI